MTDLITRLRTWSYARDAAPVSDLMDEAANEIEKLREQLLAAYRLGVSHRDPPDLVRRLQGVISASEPTLAAEWAAARWKAKRKGRK